jgi:hypothetical protein
MSLFVQRSLEEMDLESVEVVRFHGKKVTSTTKATQVVMPVSVRKKLQGAAPGARLLDERTAQQCGSCLA